MVKTYLQSVFMKCNVVFSYMLCYRSSCHWKMRSYKRTCLLGWMHQLHHCISLHSHPSSMRCIKLGKCHILKNVMWSSKMSLKSKNMNFGFFFWHFPLGYCLGFNLVKAPQRLGSWFQRYKTVEGLNKQKRNKRNYWLCLAVSYKQYLWVPNHLLDHVTNVCVFKYTHSNAKNWFKHEYDMIVVMSECMYMFQALLPLG